MKEKYLFVPESREARKNLFCVPNSSCREKYFVYSTRAAEKIVLCNKLAPSVRENNFCVPISSREEKFVIISQP